MLPSHQDVGRDVGTWVDAAHQPVGWHMRQPGFAHVTRITALDSLAFEKDLAMARRPQARHNFG